MTVESVLQHLRQEYHVLAEIDLSFWNNDYEHSIGTLIRQLQLLYQPAYSNDQRIVFIHKHDYYVDGSNIGLILKNIQIQLNEIDISNYFATIVSTAEDIDYQMQALHSMSADTVPVNFVSAAGPFVKHQLDRHPYSRKEEYQ